MIHFWNLNSKARLVVEEIPYLKSAAIGVFIKVGSRYETAEIAGGSHFVEHMLFKGTETRSARDIAEAFEGIGGQLNAYTAKEYTCVYARTLDENIYTAIDIVFDMLFNSTFSPREFETEKGVIIEEINMYEDTPDDLIHDVFAQKLWEGNPMGAPILGSLDSVSGFERAKIYDFYKRGYVPSNMVIAVAGNIDAKKVREYLETLTSNQSAEEVSLVQDKPEPHTQFINLVEKKTEQVQICLGVPGLSYWDDRRYTQSVMNSILGGGLSSRLFQSLREELGLAYAVYSVPANYSDTGSYSIYIGTGPSKLGLFFKELKKQLDKFIDIGVSQEEVLRTQQLIKSSVYLGMESVMNRMSRLGKAILMYDRVIPVEEVIDKILNITPDQVQALARDTLPKELFSLAAIGTSEALAEAEQNYIEWWE
ncbi:M16 family metallopeptidase [Syntrophomonas erecta]